MSTNLYDRKDAKIDCAYYAFMAGSCFAIFGGSTLLFFIHDQILIKAIAVVLAVTGLYFTDLCARGALALLRLLRRG